MKTIKGLLNTSATLGRWMLAVCALVAAQYAFALRDPVPPLATRHFEMLFMEDMVEHHMMAVHMSELCLAKATHPPLLQLCQKMNASQKQEISKMQAWLSAWYGIPRYQHEMSEEELEHMRHMQALPSEKFEQRFMKEMVPHHASAIRESSECLQRAVHSELIDLCRDIVTTQAAEIVKMRSWLCRWFGICWLEPSMM